MSRPILPLSLAAALLAATASAEVPRVAADIAPVHSLVARVMQGVGTPSLIVAPGATPHAYSLRPSEATALQEADLVFWIGAGLTPWMADALETLAGDAAVVTLLGAGGSTALPYREGALFEAHDHDHGEHGEMGKGHGDDHAHGDGHDHGDEHARNHDEHGHDGHGHDGHGHDEHGHDEHGHDEHGHDDEGHGDHAQGHDGHGHAHGATDTHAWLSPGNAAAWLDLIADRLAAADAENAAAYRANAEAGRAELAALEGELDAILDPVRGRGFIVFHDAYQYFERAFDMPAAGAIALSDAADPSPARLAEIRTRVAEADVACVLSEPQFDPGIVAAVMEGAPASTAVLDPLGADLEPGPGLYPAMLRNLATTLAGCL